MVKAVTVSDPTALQSHNSGFNRVAAVQQGHPMHGAHEFDIQIRPAHASRDGDAGERLFYDGRQQGMGRFADFGGSEQQPAAVGGLETFQVCYVDATGAGESFGRFRGLAVRVESSIECRSATLHIPVRLIQRHVRNQHGKPPRRRVNAARVRAQNARFEPLTQCFAEAFRKHAQRLRWQLLGADFHQQVGPIRHRLALRPLGAAESRGLGVSGNSTGPHPGTSCARAECSVGARSRRWRGANRAD